MLKQAIETSPIHVEETSALHREMKRGALVHEDGEGNRHYRRRQAKLERLERKASELRD